jgi:hypothetical protein
MFNSALFCFSVNLRVGYPGTFSSICLYR